MLLSQTAQFIASNFLKENNDKLEICFVIIELPKPKKNLLSFNQTNKNKKRIKMLMKNIQSLKSLALFYIQTKKMKHY